MSEAAIVFDNVSYRYLRAQRYALKKLDLTVKKGQFVAVLGENGAGKSTLCQLLNGVIPQTRGGRLRGRLTVAGLDTSEASVPQLARKVGLVLDDPETQLFTTSVLNEVAFGPENLGIEVDEIWRRAKWALDVVRLAGCEELPPSALSGGQKQRLAIAATLTMMPEILVLDEATSQLDPVGTVEVLTLVQELNQKHDMTIIMATDKGGQVARFCDRVLVLHEGELLRDGTPREIFADQALLDRVMIRSPQVSRLATYLDRQGSPLPEFPIVLDEARRGVEQLLEASQIP